MNAKRYITISTAEDLKIIRKGNPGAMFVSAVMDECDINDLLDNIGFFTIQQWAQRHGYEIKLKEQQP